MAEPRWRRWARMAARLTGGLIFGGTVLALAGVLVLAVLYAAQMRWMLVRIGNYGWWPSLLFPIPVVFFVGVFFHSLFQTFVLRRVSWRGRSVSLR